MIRLFAKLAFTIILLIGLTACGVAPQVRAEDRLFPNISLVFAGEYQLPKQNFQDTPVGGLSGLTYDSQQNCFYVLSDDRSRFAPARFYRLNLQFQTKDAQSVQWERITVEDVIFLKDKQGNFFAPQSLDPEGIALSPRGTVFISSEGASDQEIPPFIREFDLKTGQQTFDLRIPQRYLPLQPQASKTEPHGVGDNLGFESLTLNPNSLNRDDPFRLFTATEYSLLQDSDDEDTSAVPIRLMHYVINPVGGPILVDEHIYLLDPASTGLTELIALPQEGYFLSLERTLGLSGFGAKIFLVATNNATDTSMLPSLKGKQNLIVPVRKKLLFDLSELGIKLDNLEGMTLGSHLKDGNQTLILVSDDNFQKSQVTQFLLFRLEKETRNQSI